MRNKLTKIVLAATFGLAIIFTSCGPSAAEVAIRSAPSVEAVKGLNDKLIWLQGNAQSGGNYVLEIDSDEKELNCGGVFSSCTALSYKDKSDITIILRGIGANQTIYNGFTVKSGVTLVLDNNITLKGKTQRVDKGGTLVMNDGSTITGVINNSNSPGVSKIPGAGVYVSDGGTFLMKGGTISGNTIRPRPLTAQEVAQAKTGYAIGYGALGGNKNNKAVNKAEEAMNVVAIPVGAGVYVGGGVDKNENSPPFISAAPSGTFIKTGGTITGYASDPENGNVLRDVDGNIVNGFGHAVFFDTPTFGSKNKEPKAIDTTVGPEMTLDFRNGILKEGRNEESVPQPEVNE